jgi:hypothetical protein
MFWRIIVPSSSFTVRPWRWKHYSPSTRQELLAHWHSITSCETRIEEKLIWIVKKTEWILMTRPYTIKNNMKLRLSTSVDIMAMTSEHFHGSLRDSYHSSGHTQTQHTGDNSATVSKFPVLPHRSQAISVRIRRAYKVSTVLFIRIKSTIISYWDHLQYL